MRVLIVCLAFLFVQMDVYSQTQLSYSVEYSPHFAHSFRRLYGHKLPKFSHFLTGKAYYAVSDDLQFTFGLGLLNTGSRNISHHSPRVSSRSFNYAVATIGTKMYYGKYFVAPEVGISAFLNQALRESERSGASRRTTSNSYEIDFQSRARKVVTITTLTVGRDLSLWNRLFYVGLKSYLSIETYAKSDRGYSYRFYGIGLNFGMRI